MVVFLLDLLQYSRALIAAVNSIRLLVVNFSPPNNSFFSFSNKIIAAQPPGPGITYTSTICINFNFHNQKK